MSKKEIDKFNRLSEKQKEDLIRKYQLPIGKTKKGGRKFFSGGKDFELIPGATLTMGTYPEKAKKK